MKQQVLRIIKYTQVHEDSNSKRLKSLNYVQMPVGRESDGWEALGVMEGGLEAKGAYLELVEFAASCPNRGIFSDNKKPYSLPIIARRCRMSLAQLKQSLDLLMHEEVGFIDWIDWPVDARLIETHTHQERDAARTITSHSIDDEGNLIDHGGHPVPDSSTKAAGENTSECTKYTNEQAGTTNRGGGAVVGSTNTRPKNTNISPRICINQDNLKLKPETVTVNSNKNSEPETRKRESSGRNFSKGSSVSVSGPGSLERKKGYQLLLLRTHVLFAPESSSQHHSDRTTFDRNLWPEIWPEDLSDDNEGRMRVQAVIELTQSAVKRRRSMPPMRWFVGAVNKRISGERPWVDAKAKAGMA